MPGLTRSEGSLDQHGRREAALSDGQQRFRRAHRVQHQGNDYRLVVAVDFEKGIVWIKWIGTHRDYDRIDVTEVEHDG